ncbi:MAG: SpoIID/LytB domain-containing protein [Halanaerobiaceae bacterium]|nr:SpoIID/LytB domain-containing protein [Halanaerobiaceae bacterium]
MSRKYPIYLTVFSLIILILVFLSACEKQDDRIEIRKRDILKGEPEIIVKLLDGQERKMGLEEYITGVVAGEMQAGWPENAYAAQAIIARTFALKHMSDNDTNIISGSYQFAQEYQPEKISGEIEKAVKRTRGEVIVYEDEYINAWFHASAAGQTTSARVGLAYQEEEPPYITSVKSPDDQAPEDIKNWQASFTRIEIEETLKKLGKGVGTLRDIEIDGKDETGRAIKFKFNGSAGDVTIEAAVFRNELNPEKLRSTMIKELEKSEDTYMFSGSGFGHGVGMSQWGAYALAKEGKSPEEIIRHYYRDIEIVKEYD